MPYNNNYFGKDMRFTRGSGSEKRAQLLASQQHRRHQRQEKGLVLRAQPTQLRTAHRNSPQEIHGENDPEKSSPTAKRCSDSQSKKIETFFSLVRSKKKIRTQKKFRKNAPHLRNLIFFVFTCYRIRNTSVVNFLYKGSQGFLKHIDITTSPKVAKKVEGKSVFLVVL